MAASTITCRRAYHFDIAQVDLWNEIEHVDRLRRWWPWLEEFRIDGDGFAAGSVLYGVVAPPLPYRMRIEVELVRCVRPDKIDAVVRGDLQGEAHLLLSREGTGTRAEVSWTVEMMQRPMRLANRVAHPMLQWGHDRVVDVTVAGFRRHIGGHREG